MGLKHTTTAGELGTPTTAQIPFAFYLIVVSSELSRRQSVLSTKETDLSHILI